MGQGPFLGVELPDKFETNSSESAPEVSDGGRATDNAPEGNQDTTDKPDSSVDKPVAQTTAKPDLLDLDKHERVRFKGKEWSTKDLYESQLRHEDYTRKVQLANEERKYASNFEADLDSLVENPSLMSEFKKIYPARYTKVAEKVLENLRQKGAETSHASPQDSQSSRQNIDPEIQAKIDELVEFKQNFETRISEANVKRDSETLDSWFSEFSSKFPEADQEVVNTRAWFKAQQMEADGKTISKADVERLFKLDHESREKKFTERVRALNQKQKAAGVKGQDMGSGGGVPTAPSKKPKTFKDAKALMESDLEAGRLS